MPVMDGLTSHSAARPFSAKVFIRYEKSAPGHLRVTVASGWGGNGGSSLLTRTFVPSSPAMTVVILFVVHWQLSVFCQTFFLHRYGAHTQFTMSKGWEQFFYLSPTSRRARAS